MYKMNFYSAIDAHIEHAENKHPHFADVIDNNSVRSCNYLDEAMRYKREISRYTKVAIHDILLSEVYEFLAELEEKDLSRAKEEACDIAAVLYRAIDWLEDGSDDNEME